MAQVINTNVASLNAQRNLTTSQSSLATSLERLSSGLRINSAKDDAAGLAISERFTTQIRGLNQAIRNANDGISLSQTAEGALGEISNNLQRIRELAVQSANATNSDSDRAALNQEVQQRLAEVDRVASQTSFNGRKILDGSFGSAQFQVGANVGEAIGLNLETSVRQNQIGGLAETESASDISTLFGGVTGITIEDGDFSVEVGGGAATNIEAGTYTSATELATAINTAATTSNNGIATTIASVTNGEITLSNTDGGNAITVAGDVAAALGVETVAAPTTSALTLDSGDLTIAGQEVVGTFNDVDELVAAINGLNIANLTASNVGDELQLAAAGGTVVVDASGISGIDAATIADGSNDVSTALNAGFTAAPAGGADSALFDTIATTDVSDGVDEGVVAVSTVTPQTFDAGELSIAVGDNKAIEITGTFASAGELVDEINSKVSGVFAAFDSDTGLLSLTSSETITLDGTALADLGLTAGTNKVDGSLATANVLSVDEANTAIQRVDAALTSVSDLRSTFGAIQNRFESTIANLGSTVENLSASRSRILDADFASETANLTRAQILQQAGTAILSQANALPQNVLSLLG